MLDKEALGMKKRKLIESLSNEGMSLEDGIDRLIGYLHRYTDQRKKRTEPHGLDVWAHKGLGLERTEYTEDERKTLREYFNQTESFALNRARSLIEEALREGKTLFIKELVTRPLKDELKSHFCEIVGRDNLSGFEEDVITLYLKGTQKVSSAALVCMKRSGHPRYYFPIRKLKPSRSMISPEEKEAAISQIKEHHPFIHFWETSEDLDLWDKVFEGKCETKSTAHLLVALPYDRQKAVSEYLKRAKKELFSEVGERLHELYLGLGQSKGGDYLNDLKKAILNTLGIGGWTVKKSIQKAVTRSLLLARDYGQLGYLIEYTDKAYRRQFFKSVLNPPKHVKDETGKLRLLWVLDRIDSQFREDFVDFERYVKWHLGNEDKRVKIEALLLLAKAAPERDPQVIAKLKEASLDREYQEYFERINTTLSAEDLAVDYEEIKRSGKDSLTAKVSACIARGLQPVLRRNLKTFCAFFSNEMLSEDVEAFVFEEIHRIFDAIDDKGHDDGRREVFESFRGILSRSREQDISKKRELILGMEEYVRFEIDSFPAANSIFPRGIVKEIVRRGILGQQDIEGAIRLSIRLNAEDCQFFEDIFAVLTERIIKEKASVADILGGFQNRGEYIRPFMQYLSVLKENLSAAQEGLSNVSESMKNVVVDDILPKLKKAMTRAGGRQIFTEAYSTLTDILRDYSVATGLSDNVQMSREEVRKRVTPYGEKHADVETPDGPSSFADMLKRMNVVEAKAREEMLSLLMDKGLFDVNWLRSDEVRNLPAPALDWLYYRLLDHSSDRQALRERLLTEEFLECSGEKLCRAINQMLYRLHHELDRTVVEITYSKENQLRRIGRLIAEHLERIEIGLFGYYELRQSLSRVGLERVVGEVGAIIPASEFDPDLHEVLPAERAPASFQSISLGLRLKNGEVIRRAYLEPEDE